MGRGGSEAAAVAPPVEAISATIVDSVPVEVDRIADALAETHKFLRGAWFRAAGADSTLLGSSADGTPLIAIPTAPAGPAALGVRAVVGPYWPFRSVPIAPEVSAGALADWLGDRIVRAALGPLWRLGPFYADDPAGARLIEAANASGWTMLSRTIGRTFVLDVAAQRAGGTWPRASTLKRLRGYERQLGTVSFERVSGRQWRPEVFETLAAIERASWIGARTDGSGAKFANDGHRALWEKIAADPILADMMSVLIMRAEGEPAAFCFDLTTGATQYSIAGSFDPRFGRLKAGKIATYRNLEWALERGVERIDWGAGDSGYKREMGAVEGPEIVDCLFVRSAFVANLLRKRWVRAAGESEGDDARMLPLGRREWLLLASLATAAAAGTLAE